MNTPTISAVTGAFGFSGQYLARRLLARGETVRNLTNSPNRRSDLQGAVETHPLAFGNLDKLTEVLRGVRVLYNTYWVRFNRAGFRQADAVDNTLRLFAAAQAAGVERVVHVSITNPSEDSPLAYFAGKARLERALRESGLAYSILRPAVLFGPEDILINNIAWTLRHFPIFGLFGDGAYRVQPIHVDDFAVLAAAEGRGDESRTIDAIGPETFTFRELVRCIGDAVHHARPIVALPPNIAYGVAWLAGRIVGDVIITRQEVDGLMADLLCTNSPPAGSTRLSEWARANADRLGTHYASEVARRRDRRTSYADLASE
ncbi:MAG TPA: NAD(P)H-binding protein [Phycisphaerae bacterium]|nr:NAD(P)H-binding protein [Phycisphaerae bacterium]